MAPVWLMASSSGSGRSTDIDPVRPINASDPAGALLSREQLDLAAWIAGYYMSSLYSALAFMLPPASETVRRPISKSPRKTPCKSSIVSLQRACLSSQGPNRSCAGKLVAPRFECGDRRILDRLVSRGVVHRRLEVACRQGNDSATAGSEQSQAPEAFLIPSPHQAEALASINSAISQDRHEAFLLQGVTGSGKTEVYLQTLAGCLESGRKAILLVPEISLTPQMVQRFRARFPGRVAVIHSRLSQAEHRRAWWGSNRVNSMS